MKQVGSFGERPAVAPSCRRPRRSAEWLSALLLGCGVTLAAQPAPPPLTGTVNDFAHVMDEASARELDRRIRALHSATGDTVVVATIRTFQPYADIESYAVKMFENGGQGIGERGKDNGLLILVAVDDRRTRIEVGYDLEEFITDGYAGETIRTELLPHFRSGNYGAGLLAGATRLINRIAERRGVTLQDVPRERPPTPPTATAPGISGFTFFAFVLLLMLLSRLGRGGRRRRHRHWGGGPWSGWNSGVGPFGRSSGGFGGGFGGFGGGGGGGGFGGFGGGRSGGGGASGGW